MKRWTIGIGAVALFGCAAFAARAEVRLAHVPTRPEMRLVVVTQGPDGPWSLVGRPGSDVLNPSGVLTKLIDRGEDTHSLPQLRPASP